MEAKRVCIIGAGISGLATAKKFLAQGHSITLYEKVDTLGGVWAPARRYPGLRTQIRRQSYCFSDFPMPADYPEFPSSLQMHHYLDAYARQFGLNEHIRLNQEVTRLERRPDGRDGWRVHRRAVGSGEAGAEDFDFVVVCNGVFCTPNIPDFPGRVDFEAAGGIILHSTQLRDTKPLAGRDVVVLGFGKSAIDLAETSLASAKSAAIVCRRILWKFPRRIWGKANIKYFIMSRFTELWFAHPDMKGIQRLLHTRLRFLVDAYWRMSERVISRQLGLLPPKFQPDGPLRKAAACVGLAPPDDFAALRAGRIGFHRGGIARLDTSGIVLDTGERVPAQTILLATGYRQECPFLGETERGLLRDANGAFLLYRFLINPDIPCMGFNGYNGVGSCQLAAEIGAVWLARFMSGSVNVPDRAGMHRSIQAELALRRQLLSTRLGLGFYASPLTMTYFDRLLADLGLPPADRNKGFWRRLFGPIDPSDYRDVLAPPVRASTE